MTKHCVDCGRQVGGLLGVLRTGYCSCDKCGAHVCNKCKHDNGKETLCKECFSSKHGGGCFIATACYGISSQEVLILKKWRDEKLLKTFSGRIFVKSYYKISPPIAKFLSNNPPFKKIVRVGLNPLARFVGEY